jgi:P27 family predicted phage terminase small subunit
MRGRRPSTETLRLLVGGAGKNRGTKRAPTMRGRLADMAPPEWFDSDARAEWDYVMETAPRDLLVGVDRAALTTFCLAAVQHRKAYERLQREGLTVPTMTGEKTHPAATIMSAQAATMLRAAAEMGFTPVARSRVPMPDDLDKPAADPWAVLAGGRSDDDKHD